MPFIKVPERLQDIYGRKNEGKGKEMGKKIMEGRGKERREEEKRKEARKK